ncbi:MAG: Xaa-Pro peptidase family protein [Muribaculaceae bacterium]|nr:Xaa-Pro peptidase family protein [Muribaculaceae bacterium]
MENLILLPPGEAALRIGRLRGAAVAARRRGAMLVADNAMLYYLTGRVYSGWAYIPVDEAARPVWFVRRPVEMTGDDVVEVRKPEEIPSRLEALGLPLPEALGLEMDAMPYSTITRLQAVFPEAEYYSVSPLAAAARAVKTPLEISMMERSGVIHTAVYRKIPSLFTPGMTDFELDVAIEHLSRQEGCLGQFRIAGKSMEFFMGNVLTGENADAPSPYDFALGGKGMSPSLPVGASGEEIKRGTTVSVDVNGDYTGYMTDMTRVFSYGEIPAEALAAHECSLEIHREFRRMAVPGAKASDLYEMAARLAREAGFERYFMGHRQKAGFCGHGVGIEINETPVIAPRSRDILQAGNAIAMEPKFVIPHVGAVGIENTYIVTPEGARCITNAPEEIIPLG